METCIKKLEDASAEIDKLFEAITDKETETKAVKDGITDIPKYCESEDKILWVLKEANDPDGGWDMRDGLKNIKTSYGVKPPARATFEPIIYTSYGIIHNCNWDDITDLDKDPSVADIVDLIGFVNIKKLPGGGTCNASDLRKAYNQHGNIVLKQITDYNPDIIICGGTLVDYLIEGLGLKEENAIQFGDLKCYLQNDKIYIRAYHPSFRGDKQEYVDGIINAVREWKKKRNN
jgi:hypothetical protein